MATEPTETIFVPYRAMAETTRQLDQLRTLGIVLVVVQVVTMILLAVRNAV